MIDHISLSDASNIATVIAAICAAYAIWRSANDLRKQRAHEVMSYSMENKEFEGCKNFIQKKFIGTDLYNRYVLDTSSFRDEEVIVDINGKEESRKIIDVIRIVGGYYDKVGVYAASGAIDVELIAAYIGPDIYQIWKVLEPIIVKVNVKWHEGMHEELKKRAIYGLGYMAGLAFLAHEIRIAEPKYLHLVSYNCGRYEI